MHQLLCRGAIFVQVKLMPIVLTCIVMNKKGEREHGKVCVVVGTTGVTTGMEAACSGISH